MPYRGRASFADVANDAVVASPFLGGETQIRRVGAAERRHNHGRVVAEAVGQIQQPARHSLESAALEFPTIQSFLVGAYDDFGSRRRNREFLGRADTKDGIVAESGTYKGRIIGKSAQVAERP